MQMPFHVDFKTQMETQWTLVCLKKAMDSLSRNRKE